MLRVFRSEELLLCHEHLITCRCQVSYLPLPPVTIPQESRIGPFFIAVAHSVHFELEEFLFIVPFLLFFSSQHKNLNRMRWVHTMEYYLGIKKNAVLMHATTWRSPENIMKEARHKNRILY